MTPEGKTQLIRLADVFLVGPLMMWGGLRLRGAGGYGLAALGVATVLYNGGNYLRLRPAPLGVSPAIWALLVPGIPPL